MAGNNRRGGILYLTVDGELWEAKGDFSYNLGHPKREAIIGSHSVHDYKETVQVPYIEGAITNSKNIDLERLATLEDVTVTLEEPTGKSIVGNRMWFAGEGTPTTGEGEIPIRFECSQPLEEIS